MARKKRPEKYHKPYTDEELIIILSDAPTRANALKHAFRFQRSSAAIAMIYKWAMTPKSIIQKRGRENHAFMRQIRRIAKTRLGWLS
ncbi:MAG TPA: hypothetical protein VKT27_12485 [Candidatus Binataceae bacterium]|nr:hypothetical protein [Candidatus Binataceae bacterium]